MNTNLLNVDDTIFMYVYVPHSRVRRWITHRFISFLIALKYYRKNKLYYLRVIFVAFNIKKTTTTTTTHRLRI